jgi:hypothetical protein
VILGEELLEEIGAILFVKCTALHEILIPDAVKVIKYEFSLCTQLAIVALGEGPEKIGAGAFLGCTSLHAISIPPAVKVIKDATFLGCSHLTTVILGEGLDFRNAHFYMRF